MKRYSDFNYRKLFLNKAFVQDYIPTNGIFGNLQQRPEENGYKEL